MRKHKLLFLALRFAFSFADKPETMTLDWEHSVNKPGAVEANQEYKLRCKSTNSHPPAVHRYFKDGVELSNEKISYTYVNDTDPRKKWSYYSYGSRDCYT